MIECLMREVVNFLHGYNRLFRFERSLNLFLFYIFVTYKQQLIVNDFSSPLAECSMTGILHRAILPNPLPKFSIRYNNNRRMFFGWFLISVLSFVRLAKKAHTQWCVWELVLVVIL